MCGPYRVLVKVEQVMIYQLSPLRRLISKITLHLSLRMCFSLANKRNTVLLWTIIRLHDYLLRPHWGTTCGCSFLLERERGGLIKCYGRGVGRGVKC
jgi:hypothetical protein